MVASRWSSAAVMKPSAALFVSIDDNEVAHLRLLLDEVFGEESFVAQVVVNLNPKGRQLGWGFATSHEYLLVYARDLPSCALDASSADLVDPADFPLTEPDGREVLVDLIRAPTVLGIEALLGEASLRQFSVIDRAVWLEVPEMSSW